jgi:hypothetical protein
LSLCNQPAHPYDTAEDLIKSVILRRRKERLFIRGRFRVSPEDRYDLS